MMNGFLTFFHDVMQFYRVMDRIAVSSQLFWSNLVLGVPIAPILQPIAISQGFIVDSNIAWLAIDPSVPLNAIVGKFLELFTVVKTLLKLYSLPSGPEDTPTPASPGSNVVNSTPPNVQKPIPTFVATESFTPDADAFLVQLNRLNQFCQDHISTQIQIALVFHIELSLPIEAYQLEQFESLFSNCEPFPFIEIFPQGIRITIIGPDHLETIKGQLFALFSQDLTALVTHSEKKSN